MTAVENIVRTGPVKIGLGIAGQEAALLTAGAERVFSWPDDRDLVIDLPGVAVRPGDTIIMAQQDAIPAADLRRVIEGTGGALDLQVIGNAPTRDLGAFRKQRALVADIPMKARTGRPGAITYTPRQADAIIRLWHRKPKLGRAEINATAEDILDLDPGTLKPHWVRDLVLKFVGTARRDKPAGWQGIPAGEAENDEQEPGK